MKISSILKSILFEEKTEKKYKGGRKIITIEVNDSAGELEKILDWFKSMGDIGHSASIYCDVNEYTTGDKLKTATKIYWDGDGADRIQNIKIEQIPVEE